MAKNARGISKAIGEKYPGIGIKQRNGYVEVTGDPVDSWYSSSVPVAKINQLTLEEWVEKIGRMVEENTLNWFSKK